MNLFRSNTSISGLLAIILIALLIGFEFLNYTHIETKYVHVNNVEMRTNVNSSGEEHSVNTTFDYMVYTDQGLYIISLGGWFDGASTLNKVKPGASLEITTRGYAIPFFAVYPNIISESVLAKQATL